MPVAQSIIGQCSDCCNCNAPTVAFYPSVSVSCRSLTGTVTICGISGYDDGSYDSGDPGAWEGQGKKWKKRTLDGSVTQTGFGGFDCEGSCTGRETRSYSGEMDFTCDGFTQGSEVVELWFSGCEGVPDSSITNAVNQITRSASLGEICSDGDQFLTAYTLTTVQTIGCGCSNSFIDSVIYSGESTETLSDEQNIYDLMEELYNEEESEIVEGTSCCAETTNASLTLPQSILPITLTGTSVALDLVVTGAPSTTYTITIRFSNTDLNDPENILEDTFEEVEVTTDEEGEAEIEATVEQPDLGFSRCFAGIVTDQYQFTFRAPLVGGGSCYNLTWFERVLNPEVGMSITSIDVANGGSGYTSPPEIEIPPPDLSEEDGGIQATATATIDTDPLSPTFGEVTEINVTNGGAGYFGYTALDGITGWFPIGIEPPEEGSGASAGCVQMSGDTEKTFSWDGIIPEDYDRYDSATWLLSDVITGDIEDGDILRVACVKTDCWDCE
jgi:hypothetical protein